MDPHPFSSTQPSRQTSLLAKARLSATFDKYKLTCFIHSGESTVHHRRAAFCRIETKLGTNDMTKLPTCYSLTSRSASFREGLHTSKATFEDGLKHNHDIFDTQTPRYVLSNASPFGLTTLLFMPVIRLMGTDEQRAKYLPLAAKGKIIGAYVQTEMGHGTFVRGVETTATYDKSSDEFVIESPSVSSMKVWPGAAALSATHAVVVARLVIDGEDKGVHGFMVQVRSVEDFRPLEGIELGDMGVKIAYNTIDNGFVRFDKVRIGRGDMLSRHAKVKKSGEFVPGKYPRALYAGMVYVRGIVARIAGFQLAQASTIAVRYSVVREQSEPADGGGKEGGGGRVREAQIINHKHQHFRLLTAIARSYAILFAEHHCNAKLKEHFKLLEKEDFSMAKECHVLTAGIKAWTTQTAADGAEDCRKSCGGHGYLVMSGLPDIVASCVAMCTFEGENYVLWLQVWRYLANMAKRIGKRAKVGEDVRYLEEVWKERRLLKCSAKSKEFLEKDVQLAIFRHRAMKLVFSTAALETQARSRNRYQMEAIAAARAHTEYQVLKTMHEQVANLDSKYRGLAPVLKRLTNLFALSTIVDPLTPSAITFVEDGHLSLSQLHDIRGCVDDLLVQLLPDAVALTDAWDFTDASLCSALGCYDGNVYERLLSWLRQIPINKRMADGDGVLHPEWEDYIKPFLKGEAGVKAKL